MIGGAVSIGHTLHRYRALSVPDIGSPFPPRPASAPSAPLAPDQDAALDYTQLLAQYART